MGRIVGTIAEIPKRQMISMRVGGGTIRLGVGQRCSGAGADCDRRPPVQKKRDRDFRNGTRLNHLRPRTTKGDTLRESRGEGVPVDNLGREVSDDRAMPPLREEPGAGGVHASMRSAADARAEGEGGDGKSCDEKSSAPCDENSVGDLKPHASPSAKARQRSAFRRQTAIAAPPAHARDPAR